MKLRLKCKSEKLHKSSLPPQSFKNWWEWPMNSMTKTKTNFLSTPVCEQSITSFPVSSNGTAQRCDALGRVKPFCSKASKRLASKLALFQVSNSSKGGRGLTSTGIFVCLCSCQHSKFFFGKKTDLYTLLSYLMYAHRNININIIGKHIFGNETHLNSSSSENNKHVFEK